MQSTYKLSDVLELEAPAPSWKFVTALPSLTNTNNAYSGQGSSLGYSSQVNPSSTFADSSPSLSILVESLDVPHLGVQSSGRFYAARTINYPGRLNVGSFTINFYELETYVVTNYLTLWRNNVVNDEGNFGLPSQYKKIIRIFAYNSMGKLATTFEIHGVYPEQVNPYNYDVGSSERLKVGCTFSADFSIFKKGS